MISKEALEARKQWVAALRSGGYKQTKHVLCDADGYCCIGVAAELFSDYADWNDEYTKKCFGESPNEHLEAYNMPVSVRKKLGFADVRSMELKRPRSGCEHLWQLNDHADCTFSEIADIIEEDFIKPYEE